MRRRTLALLSSLFVAVALLLGLTPAVALAAGGDSDILLGAFFTSEADVTDTIYASYDGISFQAIATPYRDSTPNDESSLNYQGNHSTHKCPGICYYNGYFWMISNWNLRDGRFHPMLSYSKDLKHWTHPEGMSQNGMGSGGIQVDVQPDNDAGSFDVVAPKMHVTDSGELYITFCAGHFGGFHGALGQGDRMQVYTCKVTQLSATDGTDAGDGYLWPHITFSTETAKKVTAADVKNDAEADIIDSNLFSEGGTTYLLLKRDGYTEQIYSSTTPNDPASWSLVNDNASYGYEGMCVAKANGTYYLYGDGVVGVKDLGIRGVTSQSIDRADTWTDALSTEGENLHDLTFVGENGESMSTRHGDVITLKAGTDAWRLVKSMLDAKGVSAPTNGGSDTSTSEAVTVYRLYNPYEYYRMYTTDASEYQHLVSLGWRGEDVAWQAPAKSSTPVYRLYNPYSGDHLWTVDASEYDSLAKLGWRKEGVSFYSDDAHGVEVRRYFNPWITGRGSTHHYTADTSEQNTMVANGWRWDGSSSSLYGLS